MAIRYARRVFHRSISMAVAQAIVLTVLASCVVAEPPTTSVPETDSTAPAVGSSASCPSPTARRRALQATRKHPPIDVEEAQLGQACHSEAKKPLVVSVGQCLGAGEATFEGLRLLVCWPVTIQPALARAGKGWARMTDPATGHCSRRLLALQSARGTQGRRQGVGEPPASASA
jgi:hypothetical protein